MIDDFGPGAMDNLLQMVDGQIANAIADPQCPAMLEIYAQAKPAGNAEDILLFAAMHFVREYAKLAVLHFGSREKALEVFNTRTTLSTLRRIEEEGDSL
ncbi:hypothetical protein [Leifsonia aquatica]|uniref:hypothetical protein n=1 Tax=Leifsonia aquatica TaxID=144185 RepID=UPI00046A5473|nr:hypothetical protein [Leifsonia aquatica]